MLSTQTIVPILLDKPPEALDAIQADAEKVAFGFTTSISALGQSASFNTEDAAIVLEACRIARRIRAANPDATGEDVPAPALAHSLQRGSQTLWGP